jgi:hypothetical protein
MQEGQRADFFLQWFLKRKQVANFDERLARTEAEKSLELLTANKLLFYAESLRGGRDPEQSLSLYEQAFPLWTQAALTFPIFARTSTVQEDIYEIQLKYFRLMQQHRGDIFRAVLIGMLPLNVWPHRSVDKLLDLPGSEKDKLKIIPIRKIRGPMENTIFYFGPDGAELKQFLLSWSNGGALTPMIVLPAQNSLMLTTMVPDVGTPHPTWPALIDPETVRLVRDSLGLDRPILPAPPKKITPTKGQ